MSVFSIIRRGRQQAKEHSREQAERKQREQSQPAYKHVPTHAAVDALVGAPPTSRADDKPRIMEENRRRRSGIAKVATNGTQGGVPRVSSGLSNVMYPAAHANPMVTTQRSYSYQGPEKWQYQHHKMSTGVVHPVPDPTRIPAHRRFPSAKGKEAEPIFSPGSSRAPSFRGNTGGDLTASSSESIISQDGLEMTRPERPALATRSTAPLPVTAVPTEAVAISDDRQSFSSRTTGTHRLHPSRQRRLSDASIEKPLSGTSRKPPLRSPRESGPPPSTRGFSAIPPVPSVPPLARSADASHGLHDYSNVASSSSSLASIDSTASSPRTASYHSRKTPNSSVSSTGSSSSYKTPQPTTISPSAASDFVFPFSNESTSAIESDPNAAGATTSTQNVDPRDAEIPIIPKPLPVDPQVRPRPYHTPKSYPLPSTSKPKSYYPPKVARFAENVREVAPEPLPRPSRPTSWLTRRFSQSSRVSVDEVPGPQPAEPGSIAEAAERASEMKKAKPGKLVKKSRWSAGSGTR